MNGLDNPTYINDEQPKSQSRTSNSYSPNKDKQRFSISENGKPTDISLQPQVENRDSWGNSIEFLMSCIAMSVGLGNVWRFPFTALENGGGAFLIPYLICLFLVGRPLYYLEMLIGQFSSKGSVKCYNFSPAMKGVGYGQILAVCFLCTYYASLMALGVYYLCASFATTLPWSECRPEWKNCIPSAPPINGLNKSMISNVSVTSAELYFVKDVLNELDTLENGIGLPEWRMTLCLLFSWILVAITLIKGIQSAGKASYFLALFPYVVMFILLVRAVTLPGAVDGIIYFIKPQWNKILEPEVWYAAVTQVFFSLSVCFGNIIMYSSYNKFSHNVYRDANIVTSIDTFTSLLAGFTIFGILGHLAHETGISDIGAVVKGGVGLAFISYPDAIAKFDFVPQFFAVLFFLMLYVLGIGSNVAMTSCIMTIIRDEIPSVKHWHASVGVSLVGLLLGLVYVTPGGQYILNLVDHFGVSFIVFVLALGELAAISWIYGVDRFCRDVEFMLKRKTGWYWRLCWGVITPLLMLIILIYSLAIMKPLTYKDYVYPDMYYVIGWCLAAIGLLQLPIWMFVAVLKDKNITLNEKFFNSFKPLECWGPSDPVLFESYKKCVAHEVYEDSLIKRSLIERFKINIFGK